MPSSRFYTHFFHFSLLAVVIIICYSNTFDASWHFDDIPNIKENENIHIQSLTWEEIQQALRSPSSGKLSRSIALFTFALNYYISGLDTTSYHVVNIGIHAVCTLFVYLVFIHTLHLYRANKESFPGYISNCDIALLGAFFWAIHPIQTQAVTYIVQREASLAATFYMIAMYCYLVFRDSTGKMRKGILLSLAFFFWFLGMGTKENVAMLPLVLLGYEVAFYRKSINENKKFFFIVFVIFIGVATFAFLFMRGGILNYIEYLYEPRKFTLWERLITEPIILSRYLFLLVCPIADFLVLESDIVASKGLISPPYTILANIFILLSSLFSIYYIKKYPLLCFSIFFYFVNHLIESSFLGLELYFEHRNYLPSIFIFFSLSYFYSKLLIYYRERNKLLLFNMLFIAMAFIIACEGNATFLRNDVWIDEISLHEDTISKAPINPRPYIAIAVNKIDTSEVDEALTYLQRAEKFYKKYPDRFQDNWVAMIYYNAGLIFKIKDEKDKAIRSFMKSIQLDPTEWRGHVNLGILFFAQGDYQHAEDYFYNAAVLHKDPPADLFNLWGRTLYINGKYDQAIEVFRKGLEKKDMRTIHYNLSATYLKIGEVDRAKSVLLTVPYPSAEGDGVYHLYRAILFPKTEMKQSMDRLADLMVNRKIDYCKWFSDVKENKIRDVIMPDDVVVIETELRKSYQEKLFFLGKEINYLGNSVNSCSAKEQDEQVNSIEQ